jgi:hypothetical protein
MKRTLYYITLFAGMAILLLLPKQATSQKLSKYYSSFLQEVGTIYHIPSIKPFSAKKPGKELRYDITYINSKDSMTISISYFSRKTLMPDSILVTGKNFYVAAPLEKIFIEPKKRLWKYRYSFSVRYEDAQKLFDLQEPPSICIKDKNGEKHLTHISQRKWKKSANIVKQIFFIIDMNRKR